MKYGSEEPVSNPNSIAVPMDRRTLLTTDINSCDDLHALSDLVQVLSLVYRYYRLQECV